jgi:hypothetical protein
VQARSVGCEVLVDVTCVHVMQVAVIAMVKVALASDRHVPDGLAWRLAVRAIMIVSRSLIARFAMPSDPLARAALVPRACFQPARVPFGTAFSGCANTGVRLSA